MSVNNYECPRCHNVFPEFNKFLHDQHCTISNPVPLNQSRIALRKEQQKNRDLPKHIAQPNYQANRDFNNNINAIPKKDDEKEFTCWLCGNTLKEKEKADHMLCHQMQEENNNLKNENNKEENKIKDSNINRPRRNIPQRQEINQRNQQHNIYPHNNINFQAENLGRQNNNRNLKRSQLKFSDWQIFDFGGLRNSLNQMNNPTDVDILEQLPESEIEDISQLSDENKDCIICLKKFNKLDKITILPCAHIFHSLCVETWLKEKQICPICQIPIVKSNFGV